MSQSIRVNTGPDKASVPARGKCAVVMGLQAPQSALYKAQPTVKASIDSTIKAGAELAAANDGVAAAVSALRDAQGADAGGEGFAPGISGGARSRTNKNAPRTRASEMATRMNAERVVLDPRIEGGAIADWGGVLFGMPTRYNKGAAA